jgi:hypothetical protein
MGLGMGERNGNANAKTTKQIENRAKLKKWNRISERKQQKRKKETSLEEIVKRKCITSNHVKG